MDIEDTEEMVGAGGRGMLEMLDIGTSSKSSKRTFCKSFVFIESEDGG